MGKKKKSKDTSQSSEVNTTAEVSQVEPEVTYDEKLRFVSVIAKPMASKSQAKKIYKVIKKSAKIKNMLRAGLKDVQRRIRRGETGICILAGDVSPVDVICHIPAVCEDKRIPYCYTPSRMDLGAAMGVKRGSVMMLIRPHESYKEQFDELATEIKSLSVPIDNCNFPQGNL